VAFAVATTDTILPSEWSAPKLFSQNGLTGGAGKSTYMATVFTRLATAPAAPVATTGKFHFGTNILTLPTSAVPGSYSWYAGVPSGSNPVYISTFLFSAVGDSTEVTAGTWSTPVLYVQNGVDGNYTEYIFRRQSSTPTTPTGNTPAGWSDAPPAADGNPLWASLGDKTPAGVLIGSWSTPVKIEGGAFLVQYGDTISGPWSTTFSATNLYAQYSVDNGVTWSASVKIVGEDGDPGPAGTSTYLYSVFKRDTASAATPTGGSYNFGTNTGTPPSGWSNSAPAGSNQLFMSTAKVVGSTPTSIVNPITGWSAPVLVANRGSLTAYSDSTIPFLGGTSLTTPAPWNGVTDDRLAAKIIWVILGNSAASFDAAPTTVSHLVPGDTVTLRNAGSTLAATRMWSSAAWISPGVIIDGNLVVNGTIGASALTATAIDGKTITGALIRTSSGNARVQLDSATNTIKGFDSAGTQKFTLDMDTGIMSLTGWAPALGVFSITSTGSGDAIYANNTSTGVGLRGNAGANTGVYGTSTSGYGVRGFSINGDGVYGSSTNSYGGNFSSIFTSGTFVSTRTTGTGPPFTVASTAQVANLNVSFLVSKTLAVSEAWWDRIPTINGSGLLDGPIQIDFKRTSGTAAGSYPARLTAVDGNGGTGTGFLNLTHGDNTARTVLAGSNSGAGAGSAVTVTNVPTGRGTTLKWLQVPVPTSIDASGYIYIPYV